MNKPKVSGAQLREAVRTLALAEPDKVYAVPDDQPNRDRALCFYVHVDPETGVQTPGCLIGTALHQLGVSLDALAGWEGLAAALAVPALVDGEVSDADLRFLGTAQDQQDDGATWRDAYLRADNYPAGIEL